MIARSIIIMAVIACFWYPEQISAQNQADEDPYVAVVIKVTPPVQLRRSGTENLVPLERDVRLYPGDRIICQEGGFASLVFADNAVELKLYPNSEFNLEGQRTDRSIVKRVFLGIGRLLTKVTRGSMQVVTPTSVASVKGTEWWTMVDRTTLTQIVVLDGEVEVQHRATGETQVVGAGNTAVLTPEGVLEVEPTGEFEVPKEPGEPDQGSLEFEFEDASGERKTLRIEYNK